MSFREAKSEAHRDVIRPHWNAGFLAAQVIGSRASGDHGSKYRGETP
jgi:hypothetical protein